MNERLRISTGPAGEVVVHGEIDRATARMLHDAVPTAGDIVLNLCEVTYIHSAGVAVLFDLAEHLTRLQVKENSAVASVMRICGVGHVVPVEYI